MRSLLLCWCFILLAMPAGLAQSPPEPLPPATTPAETPLTLPQALERVYRDNPRLWLLRAEQPIAAARVLQASLGPNPEFTFVGEDFVGSAAFTSDRFTQFTLGLFQTLVLGDKVALRTRQAQVQQQLLYWDYRLQLQELGLQVYQGYARLLNLRDEQTVVAALTANAREVHVLMTRAVQRGKLAPAALLQSELAVKALETDARQLQLKLQVQGQELAILWGGQTTGFSLPQGSLAYTLPPLAQLEQALPRHPRLARWDTEQLLRQSGLDVARAQSTLDLNLSGGLRYHPPLDWGLVLSLGIPLPIANANQGHIEEARLRQQMWETERNQEDRALRAQLHRAYALAQGQQEVSTLLEQQVAIAREQLAYASQAFEAGKTGYLEVLAAAQNLIQLSRQRVLAHGEFLLALVELRSYGEELMPEPEGPASQTKGAP